MSSRGLLLFFVFPLALASCQQPRREPVSVAPERHYPILASTEIGLDEPVPMDVLYSASLRGAGESVEAQRALHDALTANLLGAAFESCLRTDRVQWQSALGLEAEMADSMRELPELFRFPALLMSDLDLTGDAPRLRVRLFDLSCTENKEQGGSHVPLTWERALIFEESRRLGALEDNVDLGNGLVAAWRDVLRTLQSSERFQSFRQVVAGGRLDPQQRGATLLGVASIDDLSGLMFAESVVDLWVGTERQAVEPDVPEAAPEPDPGESPSSSPSGDDDVPVDPETVETPDAPAAPEDADERGAPIDHEG
ncbi:MAG: hypothetical protein RL885_13125 [Planctomycetota bacterium]